MYFEINRGTIDGKAGIVIFLCVFQFSLNIACFLLLLFPFFFFFDKYYSLVM